MDASTPRPSRTRRLLLRSLVHCGLLLPVLGARPLASSWQAQDVGPAPEALPETGPVLPTDEPAATVADAAAYPRLDSTPPEPASAVPSSSLPAAPERAVPARQAAPLLARPRERATLPILMYHHVEDLPRSVTDPYRRDLTVPTLAFRRQLELLEANRVQTVSLDRLTQHFQGHEPLPERAVVLSFDDGYEDNYRLGFPLLRQYGMTATFFIVPNLVGQPGYVTWEQLREMQRHGMSIESHSLDHVDLAIQPAAELGRQLEESRRVLQRNLLRPVRYIAYPSGKYSPRVIAEARAVGYDAAVTVEYGHRQRSATLFELNRVRVKGADTIESFAAKLVPSHWRFTHGRFGA